MGGIMKNCKTRKVNRWKIKRQDKAQIKSNWLSFPVQFRVNFFLALKARIFYFFLFFIFWCFLFISSFQYHLLFYSGWEVWRMHQQEQYKWSLQVCPLVVLAKQLSERNILPSHLLLQLSLRLLVGALLVFGKLSWSVKEKGEKELCPYS